MDNRLDVNTRIAQGNLLEQILKPADAQYDSHSRKAASSCFEGTCVALLQQICNWIYSQEPDQLRMMYLYGLAGMGKSTIAETIARHCAEGGNLGATFFFARDYTDRRDAVHVYPTIAYQLASLIPSFQDKLVRAVQANPGVYRSSLLAQLTKLIIEPFRDVVDAPSPLVFVFYALDECGDTSDAQELLKPLAHAIKRLPPRLRVRILMTSRPEVSLQMEFASSVTTAVSHVAELHNIEDHIVQTDIRLYLCDRMQTRLGVATDDDVRRLVKIAGNLFTVASTSVKFVEDSSSKSLKGRKAQLKVLLSAEDSYSDPKTSVKAVGSEMQKGRQPYRALDAMYLAILLDALPEEPDLDFESQLRSVLGVVVTLLDTLSPRAPETLLGLETDAVSEALEQLHPVVIVPNDDLDSTPFRLIHPWFPNFLTPSSRCTDARFFVDPAAQHAQLALICLNHMKNLLKRDMCNIGFLPTLNSEVKDLQVRLQSAVPPHLRYSCYHWASHLALSKSTGAAEAGIQEAVALELARALDTFVYKKLLYWLEALSLLGRFDAAIPLLKSAEHADGNDRCVEGHHLYNQGRSTIRDAVLRSDQSQRGMRVPVSTAAHPEMSPIQHISGGTLRLRGCSNRAKCGVGPMSQSDTGGISCLFCRVLSKWWLCCIRVQGWGRATCGCADWRRSRSAQGSQRLGTLRCLLAQRGSTRFQES
ncbi:hypothetical protein FRB93_004389 [Tulasnella sp. JGI-2019a]|nr:hypothetical protein FRB93_004389 [Tulasnella sp. JGI-2019a]